MSQESKPGHQPSTKGGGKTLDVLSAARVASTFKGFHFPGSNHQVAQYAEDQGEEEVAKFARRLPDRKFSDMVDLEKSVGRVMNSGA